MVSAGKVNKSQPVFGFLAPTNVQTAAFGQPAKGAFHDPAMGRILRFTRSRNLLNDGISPTTTVLDVNDIALPFDKRIPIQFTIRY